MRFVSSLTALVIASNLGHAEPVEPDAHTAIAEQVTAELQTIDKTIAIVDDKLSAAETARLRRVRAAYRILRAPLASDASGPDRMASARRRAAARLLLERDRDERALLADESRQLRDAQVTAVAARALVPTVTLPESLLPPARGSIVRTFGTIVHERSKTTLSRRGLDFDVEPHAPAVAPADGTVRYAGPMRGLDHGVILDHGDYYTIVAKLGDAVIPIGTKLLRGDRLGHAARQRVYLELRVKVGPGGMPVDPEPLLER